MSVRGPAQMAVRFRNPLMVGSDDEGKKKTSDPYRDMPKLDYNCNIGQTETNNNNEANLDLPCNCFRPTSAVFCLKCGHIFTGRMRKTCERHPKVIHLMDSSNCPVCCSKKMKEYS